MKLRDLLAGLILITAVIVLWSWASNIGPSWLLKIDANVIECDDCPFDDLGRCPACVDIFDERMPD